MSESVLDGPDTPRLAQSLVHSQAWQEVVLPLILQRLGEHAQTAAQLHLDANVRLSAVDGQQELLGLLRTVYRLAEVMNPFDAQRLALWSVVRPPRPEAVVAAAPGRDVPPPRRRYASGSVA